ncbi:MAG: hypothetical protein K9N38_00350 [Candidatus Marinimicrobia bacterium]|nr:hypothetical protein [Candidatus Neomarinimicrobiota bacterium]
MLQIRRILLSGLVALLMVGMVNGEAAGSYPGTSNQDETDALIGAYIGSWTKTTFGRECSNTDYWQCIRFVADFSIPW